MRAAQKHKKPARPASWITVYAIRPMGPDARIRAQYRRWRLVTSRELRRAWRFTAAAALRLRSWVGFS